MFRKMSLVVAALALMVLVAQAQAAKGDWIVGLNAGTGIPISDYKDAAKVGFMGGVSFGYAATENVSIGVDGSFTANDGSEDFDAALTAVATSLGPDGLPGTSDDGTSSGAVTGKFNLLQGGAHAKYMFPMAEESKISPYVLVGAGVYNFKTKTESSNATYTGDVSENKFGARGGLGLGYKASENVTVGVEGAFHYINTDISSTQFIGLQAGVSIGLSKAQ